MTTCENNINLEYYYLLPGFSTDSKGHQGEKPNFFDDEDDEVLYYFDLNEKDDYVVTIEKVSLSKFRILEKSPFKDDLQGEFFYGRDPFYLSIFFNEMTEVCSDYYKDRCDKIMERFFLALLLVHPELNLKNPADYVVYELIEQNPFFEVSRYPGLFGRGAYYIKRDQYVTLRDIETNIYSIYKVLESLENRMPEYLTAALSIYTDKYRVNSIATQALYLISVIKLIFDESKFDVSEIKMPSSNGRFVVNNFSDIRNDLAHGRCVSPNILSGLLELCQILIFDNLACLCSEMESSETTGIDMRKRCSEKVVKYSNQNNYLFDRLQPEIKKLGIAPKFQNKLQ